MTTTTTTTRNTKDLKNFTHNGLTLPELAEQLKRQKETKKDFMSPSDHLEMALNADGKFEVQVADFGAYEVNDLFHQQVGTHYQIPKPYYERIRKDYPELLETTLNAHLQRTKDKRLVRTLDGTARAFLSASYRPLDNVDLALNAVIPAVGDMLETMRFEAQITDTRMYIKMIMKQVQGEVTKGDIVEAGVMIKNSEVGFSSLSIEPFVNRIVCMNGLVIPDLGMRKFHAGKRNLELSAAQELLISDRTRQLQDAGLWSQVRDLITATTNQKSFEAMLLPMQEAAGREIEQKPQDAVEVVSGWYEFNEDEQDRLLDNLIKGKDYTHWGMVNAITAMAHDEEDYDRATELQSLGGDLLHSNKTELKQLLTGN